MPRGKKICPKCQAEVGPRLRVCDCGHEFPFKGKTTRKRQSVEHPFEALTEKPSDVIGVADRGELKAFIGQLQTCYDDSNRSGGCYSAFLRHKKGTLQIEVWLEMRLKGN